MKNERSGTKVHVVMETKAGLSSASKADGWSLPQSQQIPLLGPNPHFLSWGRGAAI